MLRIYFSAGEPPPHQPRRRKRQPVEPVEVYAFRTRANGMGWSLFVSCGGGGWQEDHPEKGRAIFAASKLAEQMPITLRVGTSPWGHA